MLLDYEFLDLLRNDKITPKMAVNFIDEFLEYEKINFPIVLESDLIKLLNVLPKNVRYSDIFNERILHYVFFILSDFSKIENDKFLEEFFFLSKVGSPLALPGKFFTLPRPYLLRYYYELEDKDRKKTTNQREFKIMILMDYSQLANATLSVMLYKERENVGEIDENFLRHLILNSIRSYISKFKNEFGELVICCDAGNYWRKDIFPYYKAKRQEAKETDEIINWNKVYEIWDNIREEIKENFSYRLIRVNKTEADDVIGTLCHKFANTNEKILILSRDKDFRQLQVYPNVQQYDPITEKWFNEPDPQKYLKEHIIRGDGGDGVPNCLSDADSFVLKKRQKSVFQKKLDVWLDQEPEEFLNPEQLIRYRINERLVDLWKIPEEYQEKIYEEFLSQENKPKKNLMNYFSDKRLRNLIEYVNDF